MRQILLSVSVCLSVANACSGDEPIPKSIVRVERTDGRVLVGRVDARTDATSLQLTLGTPRIRLTTPVPWDVVRAVWVDDTSFTAAEFQTQWEALAVEPGPVLSAPAIDGPIPVVAHNRPAAINGDARLGHWDRKPDSDGLLLELVLIDSNGQPMTQAGQLDVQLIGLRQGARGGRATLGRKPSVLMLERWGYTIRADAFRDGVLQVRLPFRRLNPQTDIDVAADAFLKVRYGVPSQGVFELSIPDVFIREFSPFRDELYQTTGSRLLPGEQP